jgi:MFS family permease
MALGRYSLGPVSDRFGVHITVAVYIVVAMFFQIGLGIVQSATATLVILGLNGFMVAPLYPSGVVVLVSRLPLRSQLTAVAIAMGLGQMGAAVAPLGVGFMATKLGMQHLIEVVCGMSILMLLVWIAFSRLI